MGDQAEREIGWNDEINDDGSGFVLLEPGEYDYTVTKFERARHPGSAKLPPCNKAVITLKIGEEVIKTNLFLHSKCEGLLCQFFRSIGARKSGQTITMDWSKVVGARGRCKIKIRDWEGRDGEIRYSNEVDRFLDPPTADPPTADKVFGPANPAPTAGTELNPTALMEAPF